MKDKENLFSEDLIVDSSGSVDVSLPVLAKVFALVKALRLGGSYELVHQLCSQFTLIAGQKNVDVPWSRDEVLVSDFLLPYCTCSSQFSIVVLLSVNHPQWCVPPHFQQGVHLGKGAWLLRNRNCGAWRAHLGVHSMLGHQPISSGVCGTS